MQDESAIRRRTYSLGITARFHVLSRIWIAEIGMLPRSIEVPEMQRKPVVCSAIEMPDLACRACRKR